MLLQVKVKAKTCLLFSVSSLDFAFADSRLTRLTYLTEIRGDINLDADLGVVASFNKKLPKELLQLTKDGFINL